MSVQSFMARDVQLGDIVCAIQSGFAAGERDTQGVIQLRMNNVNTDGSLDWSTTIRVPAPSQQITEKYALRKGDILFNSTNSPELVGKSTVFSGHSETVVFSNHFLRIRVNSDVAVPRYVRWWLQVQWEKRVFQSLATTWVNQAAVRKEDLLALRIQLPVLSEQHRIAALLSKADRLRQLRRYALEVGEGYLQAVFLEMFVANPESRSWPTHSVTSLAKQVPNSIRTGPFGSQLLHSEFTATGDVAVIGIDTVVNNRFEWGKPKYITRAKYESLARYRVFPNDVLITIMGTLGRCAVAPANLPLSINTKHLCCISLDQEVCLPVFLQQSFLRHPQVRRQIEDSERGAIMPGLNMGLIRDVSLPLPPIQLQARFASLYDKHRRLMDMYAEATRQSEFLYQTLLHQAFHERMA